MFGLEQVRISEEAKKSDYSQALYLRAAMMWPISVASTWDGEVMPLTNKISGIWSVDWNTKYVKNLGSKCWPHYQGEINRINYLTRSGIPDGNDAR